MNALQNKNDDYREAAESVRQTWPDNMYMTNTQIPTFQASRLQAPPDQEDVCTACVLSFHCVACMYWMYVG